ncbi:MAG: hypothetical protein OZSIB_0071 [Candidatus Ozemobacter sibiricus]|jgi:hypothetical protein|uniref:Uncharacterized protein n=1 Tax=Candidatus Ozemobacter sibiricus TaxID=2268124 RepID=A0A367ZQ00_9BACT|nr:MAG: hypothetical protein OZSIB_0071 [Candidatus Ozemobacter sibiricus]
MGMVNRLAGFKNLLWKFLGQDFWTLLRKPPRDPRRRLRHEEVRFVLVQARDDTPEDAERGVTALLRAATARGLSVEYVLSSLLFLTLPREDPPALADRLCRDLIQACAGRARALFGRLPARRGLFGSANRLQAGSLIPRLHLPLTALFSLDWGTASAWAPPTADATAAADATAQPPAHHATAAPLAASETAPPPAPSPAPAQLSIQTSGQEWFVVWDAIGDGQLVGIFQDRRTAEALANVNPWYYKVIPAPANLVRRSALEWLDPRLQATIRQIAAVTP